MNLFTRISATLNSTATDAVARFENHRAIGEAAIRRAREGVAAARAAERRHLRQGEALDERRATIETAIRTWTRRAGESVDDTIALHCLQRRHDERERLNSVDEARQRHTALAQTLTRRVRELEHSLDAMVARYDELASRETLARADATLVPGHDDGLASGLDQVFERWETRVDVAELSAPGAVGSASAARGNGTDARPEPGEHADALTQRFSEQEQRRRLEDELQALRNETGMPQ